VTEPWSYNISWANKHVRPSSHFSPLPSSSAFLFSSTLDVIKSKMELSERYCKHHTLAQCLSSAAWVVRWDGNLVDVEYDRKITNTKNLVRGTWYSTYTLWGIGSNLITEVLTCYTFWLAATRTNIWTLSDHFIAYHLVTWYFSGPKIPWYNRSRFYRSFYWKKQ